MIPPDLYDAGGTLLPNRRHTPGRRKSDDEAVDPQVIIGWLRWCGYLLAQRRRLFTILTLAGAAFGWCTGYVQKARAMSALIQRMDQHDSVESRMEASQVRAIDSLRENVRTMRHAQEFQNLVLCLSVPRDAPRAQGLCKPVIDSGYQP